MTPANLLTRARALLPDWQHDRAKPSWPILRRCGLSSNEVFLVVIRTMLAPAFNLSVLLSIPTKERDFSQEMLHST